MGENENKDADESGAVRVAQIDALLDKGKAAAMFEVKALNARETGDFEYIAVVRVPSLDMSKTSPRPLEVHIDSDLTHVEINLLEQKGKAVDEIAYEIEFPDGEKRKGVTDGDGYVSEDKKGKVEKVKIRFKPPGAEKEVEREVWLDVGDPKTEEGVKRRLQNLGYDPKTLADAVRAFELDHGLPPDGLIDEDFRKALVWSHDHAGIQKPTEHAERPAGDDVKMTPGGQPREHPPIAIEPQPMPALSQADAEKLAAVEPKRKAVAKA